MGGDQTAKVWTNEYNTVALSTYKTEMDVKVGCVMILPVQHNSGPYSTGEFQGKLMPTPHLVIGGKERIKIVPIVKYDRGDTKILKDLDKMVVWKQLQSYRLMVEWPMFANMEYIQMPS